MKFRSVGLVFAVLFALAGASVVEAQHAEYYVLDGFGGVHAGGGAPVISPAPPYFGFDIARGIEFVAVGTSTATGDGLLVLDGFGGIHTGGALVTHAPGGATPYFGFDIVRGLVARNVPPRAAGSAGGSGTFPTSSWQAVRSTSILAPDDGFLLVIGSVNLWCFGFGSMTGEVSINIDSLTPDTAVDRYYVAFDTDACDFSSLGGNENTAITKLYPVSAGFHTVHVLARFFNVSPGVAYGYEGASIVALFVDRNALGASAVDTSSTAEPTPSARRRR